MSLPIIAYDNVMTTGDVTATSSHADFPVANLTNWQPSDFWKPAATGTINIDIHAGHVTTVDYFAVFSHDLGETGSTVKLQWSNDGATGWTDLTAALQKSNSQVIFETFASVSKRYFRVVVSAPTSVCSIGVIAFGEYLTMQRGISAGFTPAHLDMQNQYLINQGVTGLPLGSSVIGRAANLSFTADLITTSWARTYWEPFIAHAELDPFFFAWNHGDYPDEAVFAMMDVGKSKIKYNDSMYMSIDFSGRAWHEL